MPNKAFETYFAERTALVGQPAPTGDELLVLRSGTVFRSAQVANKAIATIADNATETVINTVDVWEKLGLTLVQGVTTPTFTFAVEDFTYIGPNQIVQTSLKAAVSLDKVAGTDSNYEVAIFVNDLQILNGMSTHVVAGQTVFVSSEIQRLLVTGDIVNMRVRSRVGTDNLIVANAQLVIG
jgi:hypothetical protein